MGLRIKKSTAILAAVTIAFIFVAVIGWWVFMARRNNRLPSSTVSASTPQNAPLAASVFEQLEIPWELVFLPDGTVLFTERPGRLRLGDVNNGTLPAQPVMTFADVAAQGEGGLLGLALHPNFENNGLIYLYYTYYSNSTSSGLANKVVRYRLNNLQN
jgi:glucose/arabinose dehydrogenase